MEAAGTKPYHMIHPGPTFSQRIVVAPTRLKETGPVHLSGPMSLRDAIAGLATALRFSSGVGTIEGLVLQRTRFTTGGPAREGKAANYTWIRDFGTSRILKGNFTFGTDVNGGPMVHCHALIESEELDHLNGGHLFPADCIVAEAGGTVTLHGLPDLQLVQKQDPETLHNVFEIADHWPGPTEARAAFVRVRPNEDAITALCTAVRLAGWHQAEVLPSLGSLNKPALLNGGATPDQLADIGMEACFNGGMVGAMPVNHCSLSGWLADADGTVREGDLVPAAAPVCVTIEAVLKRLA